MALSFDATAEDGSQAEDGKALSIMATRKYRMEVWSLGQANSWSGQLNLRLENDGTSALNGMGVLTGDQKVSAIADFKNKLGSFPVTLDIAAKFTEQLNLMPADLNISVAWNADLSGNVTYNLIKLDPVAVNLGAGFDAMWKNGQTGNLTTELSASAEWSATKNISIKAGYTFKNTIGIYPAPFSSQIKVDNIWKLSATYNF